jgi:hypothetical protein
MDQKECCKSIYTGFTLGWGISNTQIRLDLFRKLRRLIGLPFEGSLL